MRRRSSGKDKGERRSHQQPNKIQETNDGRDSDESKSMDMFMQQRKANRTSAQRQGLQTNETEEQEETHSAAEKQHRRPEEGGRETQMEKPWQWTFL